MRRALQDALYAIVIVGIGASLGLGASIVYADYLYTPYGDLTYLGVSLPSPDGGYAQEGMSGHEGDVREALSQVSDWAMANEATVLYAAGQGFVVNFGAVMGSELLERELGISNFSSKGASAYVRQDPSLVDAYVSGDVAFPGVLDLPVIGYYEPTSSIAVLNNADFVYPLAYATNSSGYMYTDAKDAAELIDLLESHGFSVTVYSTPLFETLSKLPEKLLFGGVASKALVVSMAALVVCLLYATARFYHGRGREIWIRHCYGLSVSRIALCSVTMTLALAAVQFVVFLFLLLNDRSYLGQPDLVRLSVLVSLALVVLMQTANVIGLFGLIRRFRVREGKR